MTALGLAQAHPLQWVGVPQWVGLWDALSTPWWTYDPAEMSGGGLLYRWFNLLEGTIWVVFGGLVLIRWFKHRRSMVEVLYAVAFLTFGCTDFQEARAMSAALLIIKGVNLAALLALRAYVIRKHHPQSRLF